MRQEFASAYLEKKEFNRTQEFRQEELRDFLKECLSRPRQRPTYLLVDGLDERDEREVRDLVAYLRDVTDAALSRGRHLSVCISSRRYPTIIIT